MNSVLYKYIPDRDSFFDNLLLRASSRLSLNDPFESSPSAEFWADLCIDTHHHRFGTTRDEIIDYINTQPDSSVWSELGMSLYKDKGIISFTESKDNLLMWAHYANDHKGLVIEFDVEHDFFNESFKSEHDNLTGKTTKVLYRKERLNVLSSNLLEPYFHKSDEWIYEKEHRLLLDLFTPHKVLLHTSDFKKYLYENKLKESDGVHFNESMIEVINGGNKLVYEPNALFMFEVPRECIKSVTFGCRSTQEFKDAVIYKLSTNQMKHVSVYQSEKDKLDYRLRFIKLI